MDDKDVRVKTGERFVAQLQHASTVREVFLPLTKAPETPADAAWVGDTAAALAAWALSQTSQHGFARTANRNAARAFVHAKLTPDNKAFVALAQSNYHQLFPAHCATGLVTFGHFLHRDPLKWGHRLADALTTDEYLRKELLRMTGDPHGFWQRLYLNFYKVTRLSPQESDRVHDFWRQGLQGHAPPTQWNIYQYMQAGRFSSQTFMPEVQAAINIKTTRAQLDTPRGMPYWVYTFGPKVAAWLHRHRSYPFLTGTSPANKARRPVKCFREGSPVLLPDGSTKNIEKIAEGEPVTGLYGTPERRSAQQMASPLTDHEFLYGINDYAPFFTASHPFLTTDGWKALDPALAMQVNPGMEIGELGTGDHLLQVASTQPFSYRAVEIQRLSSEAVPPGTTVHSLHLHREKQGYHVHGFCVAVHHPEHTEDTFVQAFTRLSASERTLLTRHLRPVLPLLTAALGHFVEPVLRRGVLPRASE
ncbi:hypothetical protein ABZ543_34500 [Streptomyces roseifaciens]